MSQIFISHSSNDNPQTAAIRDWLQEEGWTGIFLDFDGRRGLRGGTLWQSELVAAVHRAETVLALISPDWLASEWCRNEYFLASTQGKPVIACIIRPVLFSELPAYLTVQHLIDLTVVSNQETLPFGADGRVKFNRDELEKLKYALEHTGIAANHFEWPPTLDPDRPPFPGLNAFQEDEAGIYFGRDGEILSAIETIRSARGKGIDRIIPILGASGSGKSSFLRAGLVERLRRDRQNFITLPTVRPGQGILTSETGLIEALVKALKTVGRPRSRVQVRQKLFETSNGLRYLLEELLPPNDSSDPIPSLILPIDQAEELLAGDLDEAMKFASILTAPAGEQTPITRNRLIVLLTVRTDSFERLQAFEPFNAIQGDAITLGPMPLGEYGNVIRGPARRQSEGAAKLTIDEKLVATLLQDIQAGSGKDALPLLSFTLQRLYREFGDTGAMTLEGYSQMRGIRGSIDAAIERVLVLTHGKQGIPDDRHGKLILLRRGLIPWLASIDPETNSPRRRIARLSDIPEESLTLISAMVDERLLSVDVDKDTAEKTIEPAHESLLRQWGDLDVWLQESLADYSAIQGVKRGTRDWAASGKNPLWLVHRGGRLADACKTLEKADFAALLERTDEDYLRDCKRAEEHEKLRRIRGLRRALAATASALLGTCLLLALATFWYQQAESSASEALARLDLSNSAIAASNGNLLEAASLASSAYQRHPDAQSRSQLISLAFQISPFLSRTYDFPGGAPSSITEGLDGDVLATSRSGKLLKFAGHDASRVETLSTSVNPKFMPDDGTAPLSIASFFTNAGILSFFRDGQITLTSERDVHDTAGVYPPVVIQGRGDLVSASPRLDNFAAVADDEVITWHCAPGFPSSSPCLVRRHRVDKASAVSYGGDEKSLMVGTFGGSILSLDPETGSTSLIGSIGEPVSAISFSPDGTTLASVAADGSVRVGEVNGSAAALSLLEGVSTTGSILKWAPNGRRLAYICDTNAICITEVSEKGLKAGLRPLKLFGHNVPITSLIWLKDGARLVSSSTDGELRFWSVAPGAGPSSNLRVSNAALSAMTFDFPFNRLAVGDDRGGLFVGNLQGLSQTENKKVPKGRISGITFSSSGRLAAVVERAGIFVEGEKAGVISYIAIPDAEQLQQVVWAGSKLAAMAIRSQEIQVLLPNDMSQATWLKRNDSASPWGGVASPTGRNLYVSYTDGSIQNWDLERGSMSASIIDGEGERRLGVASLSLSPGGEEIAFTASNGNVVVRSLRRMKDVFSSATDDLGPKTVKFSPSGDRVAALTSDGWLHVWQAVSGEMLLKAKLTSPAAHEDGDPSSVTTFAWTDQNTLAFGLDSGDINILGLDTEAWISKIRQLRGSPN